MTGWLLVALGGAAGASARHLVDRAVRARLEGPMPWGILLVNVVGSFVLGLVLGLARTQDLPDEVVLAVGTGLCGALTTWSTFGYDTVRLVGTGARGTAVLNVAVSLVAGLAAAAAGIALGSL